MINYNTNKIYYRLSVYNRYVDLPYANANLDDFDFEDLLTHPNERVREFSFIVISKHIEKKESKIVKPLIAIYNKNIWHSNRKLLTSSNGKLGIRTEYSCTHHYEWFDNILINIPCNNQDEIINRFNIISNILVPKNKKKNKMLLKQKR